MLTQQEILHAVLIPAMVSALIAAVGFWRRWPWAMPLAVGAGFVVGYACIGVPKFPPSDGSDWLFWLAIPVTALGVVDALAGRKWGWVLAAFAGAVVVVIVRPLVPASVPSGVMWATALAMAAAGAALTLIVGTTERRLGAFWALAALCVVMGGAGVVVFSSNFRTMGTYGIAAAAATGPVVLLAAAAARTRSAARSVAVVLIPLLAGLLASGHFYPDTGGVTWVNLCVLMAAPALLLVGAFLPVRRNWIRGGVALLAVIITVAAVTGPTALAAKKAAEADPYDAYK